MRSLFIEEALEYSHSPRQNKIIHYSISGKPFAFDIRVTSSLSSTILSEVHMAADVAVGKDELRMHAYPQWHHL